MNTNPKSSVTTPTEKNQLKQMETSMTFANVLPEENVTKTSKFMQQEAKEADQLRQSIPSRGRV